MNRPIANDGKFMGARCDEDEHGIAIGSPVHPDAMKLFLRRDQRVAAQVPALNINADLTGGI